MKNSGPLENAYAKVTSQVRAGVMELVLVEEWHVPDP